MRKARGLVATGLEAILAALLLGAAGLGLWQLNRPLPHAGQLIAEGVPVDALVVDARGPLAYRRGHLPDARRLWARELLTFEEAAGALAEAEVLERKVAALGIEPGEPVVVYDDGGGEEAALVLLVLRAFGLDARILEGGLEGWLAGGGEPSTSAPPEPEPDPPQLEFDSRLIVNAGEAKLHMAANEVAPLDVRGRSEYLAGHLEGAVNLPATELLPGGRPPRWSVLARALGPARITSDTHPLIYGDDAVEAAMAWLALAAYGVEHVHVLPDPFPILVERDFAVSQAITPAATSTRTSSVCWR